MIKINLEDTYTPFYINPDLQNFIFKSELKDKTSIDIHVSISQHPDVFLPDVYNLGFGPLNETGGIDDIIKLKHTDVNKVFSTVLLLGITFLQKNIVYKIGIDGSDDIRAYLYHRMFRHNIDNLSDYLSIIGVDWYVKLLRNRFDIERDINQMPLFKPRPEPFDMERKPRDLYSYYIFSLR